MRYLEYRNKMIKTKKAVIIAGIAFIPLVLGSIGAAIGVTSYHNSLGNIESVDKVNATYKYGEGISLSGKAKNSNVTFEYAHINQDDWSESVPYMVGKYQVRGRTNGYKTYKYSEVQTFEIAPIDAKISIRDDSVNYGYKANIKTEGLVGNDSISSDYVVEYSTLIETSAVATINPESVTILNRKNEDVTSCYNLTFEEKEINFNPQTIRIAFYGDVDKIYDGQPISSDDFSVVSGSLFYGDQIAISNGISPSDIGFYTNTHSAKVVTKDGVDNPNYNVVINRDNTFNIKPRPLNVKVNNLVKEYDGEPFEAEDFSATYTQSALLPEHEIVYSFDTNLMDNYLVRTENFTFESFSIRDKNTLEDVSSLYNVSIQDAVYQIMPRNIKIESNSIDVFYDGNIHSDQGYTIKEGSIASSDQLEVISYSAYGPDASDEVYDNVLNYKIIRSDNNEDVTNCYAINNVPGSIMIKKIILDVTFEANAYTYDAQYHEIYDLSNTVVENLDTTKYAYEVMLPDSSLNRMKDYQEDGYKLTKTNLYIKVLDLNSNDISQNFDITYHFGTGVIEKKALSINAEDYLKTYDGKTLEQDINNFAFTSEGLIEGHQVKVDSVVSPVNTLNASSGDLILSYNVFDADNQPVTSNYDITIDNGEYTINKRNITINVALVSKVYDGTNIIKASNIRLSAQNPEDLATTDSIRVDSTKTYTVDSPNAGTHSFMLDPNDVKIVARSGGADRKENYIFSLIQDGQYVITQRNVNIRQARDSSYYDGAYHGINNAYDFSTSGLISGHTISFNNLSFKEIGKYTYDGGQDPVTTFNELFNPVVYDANHNNVTSNYYFTYDCTFDEELNEFAYKFEIMKKHLIIETYSYEKVFDNMIFSPELMPYSTYTYGFTQATGQTVTFDEGDYLVVESNATENNRPTYVNDSTDPNKNQFTFNAKILNAQGIDVTENYDVEIHYGSLTIKKCKLTVESGQFSLTYNGKTVGQNTGISDGTYNITNKSKGVYLTRSSHPVPQGYSVIATISQSISDKYLVGNYSSAVTVQLYDEVNERYVTAQEVKDNITFTVRASSFKCTIAKKSLSIETSDVVHTYNIKRPAPETRMVYGLASGDKLYFGNEAWEETKRYYASVTDKYDVGTYENEIGEYSIRRGSVDVTSCYDITTKVGTVIIQEA